MSYRKLFYLTRKLTVKKDSTQSAQYWHPQLPAKYLLQITRNKNTYYGSVLEFTTSDIIYPCSLGYWRVLERRLESKNIERTL